MDRGAIRTVAVLGAGTMGAGIAALCAAKGCRVLLVDVTAERAEQAIARMREGARPMLADPGAVGRVTAGAIDADLPEIGACDWVCEAAPEDLAIKRDLFFKLADHLSPDTIVSSNTSGTRLGAILDGMPETLRRRAVVTHFFNPVATMKLMELVPSAEADPAAVARIEAFCRDTLGKGVVRTNDTVNFVANRIGCFFMLAGLHKGEAARAEGLSIERIDAVLNGPVGLPATGLYGLIDLIGLDVMADVAANLEANLPANDAGRAYTSFPASARAMLERGQVGRKADGGFYRLRKLDDGDRLKETYDPERNAWRPSRDVALEGPHRDASTLMFEDDPMGRLAWAAMGETLFYAADLVPTIADDIVSVDNAMRWGFGWREGPFELLDRLRPGRVIARLEAEGRPVPAMLRRLRESGRDAFYTMDRDQHFGVDGRYHRVAA